MSDEERRLDLSGIGTLAADAMQALEESILSEVGEEGKVPTVTTVGIVVELDWPDAPRLESVRASATMRRTKTVEQRDHAAGRKTSIRSRR
jgi:hypothetical protein